MSLEKSVVAEHGGDDFQHLAVEFAARIDHVPDTVFAKHTAFQVFRQSSGFAVGKVLFPFVAAQVVVDGLNRLLRFGVQFKCRFQGLDGGSGLVEVLLHGLYSLN